MRLPATSFAGVLGAYDILIHWGDREYREDTRTLRRNAYEDLLDGLRHLEPRAADSKSKTQMKAAHALAEKARVMYSAGGDIAGSVAVLELSREAFLSIGLKPGVEDQSASWLSGKTSASYCSFYCLIPKKFRDRRRNGSNVGFFPQVISAAAGD